MCYYLSVLFHSAGYIYHCPRAYLVEVRRPARFGRHDLVFPVLRADGHVCRPCVVHAYFHGGHPRDLAHDFYPL